MQNRADVEGRRLTAAEEARIAEIYGDFEELEVELAALGGRACFRAPSTTQDIPSEARHGAARS